MKEHKCPKDYGHPSGHAFMSCVWGFMIYFDLKQEHRLGTTAIVALPYTYTLALGYSRLIMGSHSLL